MDCRVRRPLVARFLAEVVGGYDDVFVPEPEGSLRTAAAAAALLARLRQEHGRRGRRRAAARTAALPSKEGDPEVAR